MPPLFKTQTHLYLGRLGSLLALTRRSLEFLADPSNLTTVFPISNSNSNTNHVIFDVGQEGLGIGLGLLLGWAKCRLARGRWLFIYLMRGTFLW